MKRNIFINMTHDYYVDVAKQLIALGSEIRAVGASKSPEYWPSSLDGFIATVRPRLLLWEDFNLPERFAKILDPDYSILTPEILAALSYYEKMFLLSTDRLSFFPISQIDRCRLFYRFVGHFYKILRTERIDSVIFFGIPHGLAAIALFGLAKILKLDAVYVEWAGLSPNLSTIETELKPRRAYTNRQMELGSIANEGDAWAVHDIVSRSISADCVWNPPKPNNRTKVLLRTVGSLLLRAPFKKYVSPEFFLNAGRRIRIGYIPALIKYHVHVSRAIRFYDRHTCDEMPDGNSLVLFLHFQPEAVTMPQGGIFADQLLVFDIIMAALPEGMNVYVKEHPFMFDQYAQDKHERSTDFYAHMLKDPRVHFVKRSVSSKDLIDRAKLVASTNGTISWEAMRVGKPCIIFGWSWFSACESCFVVESVDSLKEAFVAATRKSADAVIADVHAFLERFERRLIYAAPYRFALDYVEDGFSYEASVARLARAIAATFGQPGAFRDGEHGRLAEPAVDGLPRAKIH